MQYRAIPTLALAGLTFASGIADAQTNLVQNGSFEQLSGVLTYLHANNYNQALPTGWTKIDQSHYYSTMVYAQDAFFSGGTWGGVEYNGAFTTPSPSGGNFVMQNGNDYGAANPGYSPSVFGQQINNLVVGQTYQVSFYQAASGVRNQPSATGWWTVSFGGGTQTSVTMTNSADTSSPWQLQTMYFTATSTSQFLGFLASATHIGTSPTYVPVALDGVSVVAVPEPSSMAMTLAGCLGLGFICARRRQARD